MSCDNAPAAPSPAAARIELKLPPCAPFPRELILQVVNGTLDLQLNLRNTYAVSVCEELARCCLHLRAANSFIQPFLAMNHAIFKLSVAEAARVRKAFPMLSVRDNKS